MTGVTLELQGHDHFVVQVIPNAGDRLGNAVPKKIELPLVEWGIMEALPTG